MRKTAGKFARFGLPIGALLLALIGAEVVWHGPGPAALRQHPVGTHATVTDVYIDGFGGDPTVDYEFQVAGRTYRGSGTGGQLGNGDVLRFHIGDEVAIQYAASDPSLSCTCDARTAEAYDLPRGGFDPFDLILFVPLAGVIVWFASRRINKHLKAHRDAVARLA